MNQPRILIVSNADELRPDGQSTRPLALGAELEKLGATVGLVGTRLTGTRHEFCVSTGRKSLRRLGWAVARAVAEFEPEFVYAHQNLPAVASLLATVGKQSVRVVADFHSIPSSEWANVGRFATGARARAATRRAVQARVLELFIAARADSVIAAGAEVGAHLRDQLGYSGPLIVAPNGAPVDDLRRDGSFALTDRMSVVATIPKGASDSNRSALAFLADVARTPQASEVNFHVLGSETPAGQAPRLENVTYHGYVRSLGPWLRGAGACVLPYPGRPALAGGARSKLLEALCIGRRVVSTPEGLRGMPEARSWPGVSVARDDPDEFAASIRRALLDGTTLDDADPVTRASLSWSFRARLAAPAFGL